MHANIYNKNRPEALAIHDVAKDATPNEGIKVTTNIEEEQVEEELEK